MHRHFHHLTVERAGIHRLYASLGYRRMACLGVVGAAPADAAHGLIGRYLGEQVASPTLLYVIFIPLISSVFASMPLSAPCATAAGTPPAFLAFPFAFAQELDPCAFHQQAQRRGAGRIGQLHQ